MENLNLCEILKGHEGETFYSIIHGNVTLSEILDNTSEDYTCISIAVYPIRCKTITGFDDEEEVCFTEDGLYDNSYTGECILFPSKDQRDWNKWIEEQKPKVPKTWSEYTKQFDISSEPTLWFDSDMNWGEIGKACAALFKIHRLIEVGYGRNVTNEEWFDITLIKYIIDYDYILKPFKIKGRCYNKHHVAFHTPKQAEEFLKYPENVQLLKDYFMI